MWQFLYFTEKQLNCSKSGRIRSISCLFCMLMTNMKPQCPPLENGEHFKLFTEWSEIKSTGHLPIILPAKCWPSSLQPTYHWKVTLSGCCWRCYGLFLGCNKFFQAYYLGLDHFSFARGCCDPTRKPEESHAWGQPSGLTFHHYDRRPSHMCIHVLWKHKSPFFCLPIGYFQLLSDIDPWSLILVLVLKTFGVSWCVDSVSDLSSLSPSQPPIPKCLLDNVPGFSHFLCSPETLHFSAPPALSPCWQLMETWPL